MALAVSLMEDEFSRLKFGYFTSMLSYNGEEPAPPDEETFLAGTPAFAKNDFEDVEDYVDPGVTYFAKLFTRKCYKVFASYVSRGIKLTECNIHDVIGPGTPSNYADLIERIKAPVDEEIDKKTARSKTSIRRSARLQAREKINSR